VTALNPRITSSRVSFIFDTCILCPFFEREGFALHTKQVRWFCSILFLACYAAMNFYVLKGPIFFGLACGAFGDVFLRFEEFGLII